MKKIFSVATLILFLIGTLSLVFCTRSVKAEPETIYIRANGLVEGTDKIQRVGDLYTFIDNIYDSIVVERSSIVIDGNGYVLEGSGSGNGFELQGIRNVIIRSTNIERFNWGVYLGNSSGNSISGNNLTSNNDGVRLSYSSNNSISGNKIAANNGHGILLQASSGNSVSGNTFIDDGLLVYDSYQSSVENNTVNGRPLVYLEGVLGYTVDDAGQVILVKCDDVRVEGLNLSRTGVGIELLETRKCTISGNNITANNYDGIRLYSSPSNNVSGNNIAANNNGGLFLSYASGNSIYHNNFIDNANHASLTGSVNVWDDGYPSGGNCWSNYTGLELNPHDGIGDTPHIIDANNVDRYPLMGPFRTFDAGTWNNVSYNVDFVGKSNVTNFDFNPYASPKPTLSFDVEGQDGTTGFVRIAIPRGIMWCDSPAEWTITVGGNLTAAETILEDANYTYIYFTYTHSTKTVQITSTHAIPEFQQILILPLLMIVTLLAIVLRKGKRDRLIQVQQGYFCCFRKYSMKPWTFCLTIPRLMIGCVLM